MGCSFYLSHGYQIPNCKWSRNGPRKPAHSQGMLLNINEAKYDRQHLHGRARYARRGNHPTCALMRIRACAALLSARTPRLHRIQVSIRHQKLSHLFSKAEHRGIRLETGRHGWGRPGSDHPQVKWQSLL